MTRGKAVKTRVMRMRLVRRSREMTQAELAARVGVDTSTICLIEKGLRQPSEDTAREIASTLGLSIDEVFDYVEVPA